LNIDVAQAMSLLDRVAGSVLAQALGLLKGRLG
jgi:hypothetical protein